MPGLIPPGLSLVFRGRSLLERHSKSLGPSMGVSSPGSNIIPSDFEFLQRRGELYVLEGRGMGYGLCALDRTTDMFAGTPCCFGRDNRS